MSTTLPRPSAVPCRPVPLVPLVPLVLPSVAGTSRAGVDIDVRSDWGQAMIVDVTIDNDSDETLADWRLSFGTSKAIERIWSAGVVSRDGDAVTLKGVDWNRAIAPGASVSFGFVASPSGGGLPDDLVLSDFAIDGPAVPTPGPVSSPVTPTSPTSPPTAALNAPTPPPVGGGDDGLGEPGGDRDDGVLANGKLGIDGARLIDQQGDVMRLEGMSSHGLQWFGEYMNVDGIRWLRDDWNANVVRAAMYTDPDANGYVANPALERRVYDVVDAAIELDMYVIVDWHILKDNDPNRYRDEAIEFFDRVSARYSGVPNVIYEIANEPNPAGPAGVVRWREDIVPYAEAVIPVIRANAPDSVVIVGTPTWSQDVDEAAAAPLDFGNIAYAMHFYACTHGQALRDKVDLAIAAGAAVFVSEWGTTSADGNGSVCEPETRAWIDFLDARDIGRVNWSLADKREASAALAPGASIAGGWGPGDLTRSGRLVRELMRD